MERNLVKEIIPPFTDPEFLKSKIFKMELIIQKKFRDGSFETYSEIIFIVQTHIIQVSFQVCDDRKTQSEIYVGTFIHSKKRIDRFIIDCSVKTMTNAQLEISFF